ncbi:Conserved_hypothetical protein [Hexamita inflata]|uniref:Ankyrin repeat-containing protein n=1 Tax=Hexamita inflata TaxID=28002 RepID=A0ABP1HH41_9EUKA
MSSCKKFINVRWFEAAKQNNAQYIVNNKHMCIKAVDERMTNYSQNIYNGFTALHYAVIFGNIKIINLLAEEILITTKSQFEHVLNNKEAICPRHQSVLSLAIIFKRQNLFGEIMKILNDDKKLFNKFLTLVDAEKKNFMYYSLLTGYGIQLLLNPVFTQQHIIKVLNMKPNPIIFFCESDLSGLAQLIELQNAYPDVFDEMILKTVDHDNIMTVAKRQFEGCGQYFEIIRSMCLQAFQRQVLNKNSRKIVEQFTDGKSMSELFGVRI